MKKEKFYNTNFLQIKSGDAVILNDKEPTEDSYRIVQHMAYVATSSGFNYTVEKTKKETLLQTGFRPNEKKQQVEEVFQPELPLFFLISIDTGRILYAFPQGEDLIQFLRLNSTGFIPNEELKLYY